MIHEIAIANVHKVYFWERQTDRLIEKDTENKPKGPVLKSLNSLDNLFSSISGNRPTLNSQLFVYYEGFFKHKN